MAKARSSQELARSDERALQIVRECLGRAEKRHDTRCRKFRQHHRAYLGILERDQDRWESQYAPKIAFQIMETLAANIIDVFQKGRVLPEGRDDEKNARALELVQNQHRKRDRQDETVPLFARSAVINGIGIGKSFWHYSQKERTFRRFEPRIDGTFEEFTETRSVIEDRLSFEPQDVYDWMPDPSASRVPRMGWAIGRYWLTPRDIKAMARRTLPDGTMVGAYRNVDKVGDTRAGDAASDSQKATGRDHSGRVEVLEWWSRNRLIVVANRSVVLQDEQMPFDHGELPWIVAHCTPDLYSIDGISPVEVVDQLQAAYWELLNQAIDNVRLANNLQIKVRRSSLLDRAALTEGAPGNVHEVDDMDDVQWWMPTGNVLQPAMDMMGLLKTAMQETTGANAYLAGGASDTIDQKTATGISLIQSMAQKLVQLMRSTVRQGFRQKGLQEISNLQQFLTKPEVIRIDKQAGFDWREVYPWELQGAFDYDSQDEDESLNEQQARQEAMLLLQTVAGVQPLLAGEGKTVELVPLVEKLLQAFGMHDTSEVIKDLPPPPPTLQLPPGAAPGGGAQVIPLPGLPGGPGGPGAPPGTPPGAGGAPTFPPRGVA